MIPKKPKSTRPLRSLSAPDTPGTETFCRTSNSLGPTNTRSRGRAVQVADGSADDVDVHHFFRVGLLRIARTDNELRSVTIAAEFGSFGNKHGREILIRGAGPMEGARNRLAAAHVVALREQRESAFDRQADDVFIELVVDRTPRRRTPAWSGCQIPKAMPASAATRAAFRCHAKFRRRRCSGHRK